MDPADVVSGVQKMALGVIIAIVVGVILLVAVLITCCVCMCKVCAGRKKETHTVVYQAPPPHGYAADPNHPQFQPWPPGAQPPTHQAVSQGHLAPQHQMHPGTRPMTAPPPYLAGETTPKY
ncbi:protein shisa-5-like [Ixodes scapularis]|uniref:protein shisa-5-like n=1 Tax=Ixodes scapularis TaxID=6945 RepID=UPI001A9D3ECC|nr:protein shisa-5-like [Ixodes scapularis]